MAAKGRTGLYLNPDKAVCCAWTRNPRPGAGTQGAGAALRPGIPEKRSHDYIRHGTTALFAALEAHRQGHRRLLPPARHEEFLAFLKQVARAYRGHCTSSAITTARTPPRRTRLAGRHPGSLALHADVRVVLNMAEVFFSIITRQAIRRGSFTSVKDLIAAIEAFIDGWNDRCHPLPGPRPPTRYSRSAASKRTRPPSCPGLDANAGRVNHVHVSPGGG